MRESSNTAYGIASRYIIVPERERLLLSVLLFNEGETWVVQCLEYDIVAQGESPRAALEALGWTIGAHILLDREKHRKLFSTLQPAPDLLRERFTNAIPLSDPYPLTLPVLAFELPVIEKDVRLAS
ncbi:MAG TPA: hypothetical protein VNE82_24455 [Candidatus Binataceae bacterium]|nr:hypothetical protein [Candidatus Binataceae bacterium]